MDVPRLVSQTMTKAEYDEWCERHPGRTPTWSPCHTAVGGNRPGTALQPTEASVS